MNTIYGFTVREKETDHMSYDNWKDKEQTFQTIDVRHLQGNFSEGLKKKAKALDVDEGLHIIQTFEPHPLYAVMEGLGYEHHTEQRGGRQSSTSGSAAWRRKRTVKPLPSSRWLF